MKLLADRLFAVALAMIAVILLAGAASKANGPVMQPDKLVILSTTDVKGKTSPCG